MALTEIQYQTMILTELGAVEFLAEITTPGGDGSSLWDLWFLQGNNSNAGITETRLRVSVMRFLQGKYWRQYSITQGTEKRDCFQQWQAMTRMLADEVKKLEKIDPLNTTAFLNVSQLTPILPTTNILDAFDPPKGGEPYGL